MFSLRSIVDWILDRPLISLVVAIPLFYLFWFFVALIARAFQKTVRRFREKTQGEIGIFFLICTVVFSLAWIVLAIIKSQYDVYALIGALISATATALVIDRNDIW